MAQRARFAVAATGLLALLGRGGRVAAQTGDVLCDAQSTADTCVITADFTIPDGSVLTFTAPNVRLRSSLTTAFTGRCSSNPAMACASDADCTPPARCERTAQLTVQVAALLTLDPPGQITARGQAGAGDVIGPDGGTIAVTAHDINLGGTIDVSAQGAAPVPAGNAGMIAIDADGTVTLASTASLSASTSDGGCGGAIGIGIGAKTPATLNADGLLSVEGATLGGTIHLLARDQLTLTGALRASNTDGDPASRPACPAGAGGGTLQLAATSVSFMGSARAVGREAAGGTMRLEGVRAVTLDSPVTTAISVTGGDVNAFTTGGSVFLSSSAGDVLVQQGAIEADGLSRGFGSDAGFFALTATGTLQCQAGGTLCASSADCAPGDACMATGGRVTVEAPVSAAGGAGLGSGCVACAVTGTGAVAVSAAIDVNGGKQGGVGGKVSLAGGGDLTVGPGPVTADAFDGGAILLTAGTQIGALPNVSGALTVVNGTQVTADAFGDNRFGGDIAIEGCDVTLQPSVLLGVDGGSLGHAGQLTVIAHEQLAVDSLATLSALPNGASALSYLVDASVAPDATLQPAFTLVMDPTLTPCPVVSTTSTSTTSTSATMATSSTTAASSTTTSTSVPSGSSTSTTSSSPITTTVLSPSTTTTRSPTTTTTTFLQLPTTTTATPTSSTTTRPTASLPAATTTTAPSPTTTLPCPTARCTLEGAQTSSACAGQAIPAGVTGKLTQAENLIDQAAMSPAKRARKLLDKGRRALRQAGVRASRAAKGRHPKISSDCAGALRNAADGVAAGL